MLFSPITRNLQYHSRRRCNESVGSILTPVQINKLPLLSDMSEDQWKSFALWMPRTSNDRIWGGGTGQSWIIRQILGDMEIVYGSAGTHGRVLLITHQGSAAFLIGGRTLSSALRLPNQPGSTFRREYAPLASTPGDSSMLCRLQNEYEHVHIIIIDGFGIVSCGMLYWIDQRLHEIFPRTTTKHLGVVTSCLPATLVSLG
jgi:hypothetical protein